VGATVLRKNIMIMNIPIIKPDLPCYNELESEFREILGNGKITNFGKYVMAFEQEAAAYLGGGVQVAATCNATTGLIFALQALGVKPGKKVILPSMTFMATAQAVLYAGGEPIFADIGDDFTISVPDLEQLLEKHRDTVAVLPVHIYGLPCSVASIQAAADRAGKMSGSKVSVLYDAAHAFGSAIDSVRVGTFGDAEVFSLSVTKMLVSVEGGMISSKNPLLIHQTRKMRNYGIEEIYDAHWQGLNGKMSEFHAIIGRHNLKKLDVFLEERRKKAIYYIDQVQKRTIYQTPPWPQGITHTFKDFTILLPTNLASRRPAVMDFLKNQGVETRAYFYPPLHKQTFFRRFADRPLPRTDDLGQRVITLPFYTTISNDEMDYIVDKLVKSQDVKG
jgi:dTDP-4-amino-4,6-dideoxygalactose transaminase